MGKNLLILLHVAFVGIWLGCLLYLPHLFALHSRTTDRDGTDRLDNMAHLLFFRIASPSAVLAVALGTALIFYGYEGGWLPVKLALVLLLVVFHVYCGKVFRELVHDIKPHGAMYYRFIAWMLLLPALAIIALAAVKPF